MIIINHQIFINTQSVLNNKLKETKEREAVLDLRWLIKITETSKSNYINYILHLMFSTNSGLSSANWHTLS